MSFYFNSIKVRLEPNTSLRLRKISSFQFHKGTIRTTGTSAPLALVGNFNSIKVRLERSVSILPLLCFYNFNSIKVRLEQGAQVPDASISSTFQFHKGTIRTRAHDTRTRARTYFNSIKVRLERCVTRVK